MKYKKLKIVTVSQEKTRRQETRFKTFEFYTMCIYHLFKFQICKN